MSTSIWAGGPEGRIDPARGALGARYRRFIGESMALRAITCAPLPNGAIMWDIMSAHPPASLPEPVGYPPIFVIWRWSGGPSRSMYSKVAGISETDGKNRRYASSSLFARRPWCQGQLDVHYSEASMTMLYNVSRCIVWEYPASASENYLQSSGESSRGSYCESRGGRADCG